MEIFEIFLSAIIVFLGFILSYKWKKLKKFQKRVLSLIMIATLILTIVQIKIRISENNKEELIERVSSKFGEIDIEGDPVLGVKLGNEDDSNAMISTKKDNPISIIHPKYGPMFEIRTKEGKLNVYILIRDFNGEIIAVIEEDTWTVFDNNYEYNDDDKAFELVTKGDRKVFFQMEYKNDYVHIAGYFITKEGYGFAIHNDENGISGMYAFNNPMQKEEVVRDIYVPRLFKYPRSKYYGERLN